MDIQKDVNKILSDEEILQNQLNRMYKYLHAKDWKAFIEFSECFTSVLPWAFFYYDQVPDEMKYDFAINAYISRGDSVPAVRKAVRLARRYGGPNLPDELRNLDWIKVYRAGEEPVTKAKYRISWTTDIETAVWFHKRNLEYIRRPSHVYCAKIRPADCIAYTDERHEREIMQYRKVFDVEDITAEV